MMSDADRRLSDAERRTVLRIAEDALEAAVTHRPPRPVQGEAEGHLGEPGACFVTLYEHGDLRGCIGSLVPTAPLGQVVRAMTEAAALRDPRFRPVSPPELPGLSLSLSVLTPMRRIDDPREVQVGLHGLVVSRGDRRGVLLPQVAVERGWDRETFLEQTCIKASLPIDAWQDPETTLEVFSAEVFGPSD